MAAEQNNLQLPFGFVNPAKDDFGALGRALLREASRQADERQSRARLLAAPALFVYLIFAFGVGAVLWAMHVKLSHGPFLAVVTLSFLAMAVLGKHYSGQPSWTMAVGGIGKGHSVLLIQAFMIKALTSAFFILPYRVMTTLADLFPRRPNVDSRVLTVAVHLLAALDEAVSVRELAKTLPRGVGPQVLEEAVILLAWANAARAQPRGRDHLAIPEAGRDEILARISPSEVVSISSLRRTG